MEPINVTAPALAPLHEFLGELSAIWETGNLSNTGPQAKRLETDLGKVLGLNDFIAVTNGTVALQMAIKSLNKTGEIITPAFSFIATVSAIVSEGCTPIYCDIDEKTFNIDVSKIEELITENTIAIMPVHVFGNPCDIEALSHISMKYSLPIIYDAAHAMGSTYNGRSILSYGHVSALSMHATKIFNTGEGGGLYSRDPITMEKLREFRNFGMNNQKQIVANGFNGKMSEIHAALGNANLKYFYDVLSDRREKWLQYYSALSPFSLLKFQEIDHENTNFSYFPIILESEASLVSLLKHLEAEKIFPRRYFYPSLNAVSLEKRKFRCPVSEDISKRILCLPLSKSLRSDQIELISSLIIEWGKK